jgi:hypothetical protein
MTKDVTKRCGIAGIARSCLHGRAQIHLQQMLLKPLVWCSVPCRGTVRLMFKYVAVCLLFTLMGW